MRMRILSDYSKVRPIGIRYAPCVTIGLAPQDILEAHDSFNEDVKSIVDEFFAVNLIIGESTPSTEEPGPEEIPPSCFPSFLGSACAQTAY